MRTIVVCVSRVAALLVLVVGCTVVFFERHYIDHRAYEINLGLLLAACGAMLLFVSLYHSSRERVLEDKYAVMRRVIDAQKCLIDMQVIELSRCRGIIEGYNTQWQNRSMLNLAKEPESIEGEMDSGPDTNEDIPF